MKLCARLGVSQKRHGPGKILCATILGWLYYVIFIFLTLFSRGVIFVGWFMTPQLLGNKEKKISNSFGGRHKTWKPWRERNGRGPWRQKRELQQRKPICRWPELVNGREGFLGVCSEFFFLPWRKCVCVCRKKILLVLSCWCCLFFFLCWLCQYLDIIIWDLYLAFVAVCFIYVSLDISFLVILWIKELRERASRAEALAAFCLTENGKNSARALQCFRRADLVLSFFFLHHFSIAWCP